MYADAYETPTATWMRYSPQSTAGERYGKRKQTVEPLYGDTKHNKDHPLPTPRQDESAHQFRLLMMADDLTKIQRHQIATAAA